MNATAVSTSITRALALLGRANADWRKVTADMPGTLHWPVAVDLALRELAKAESLEPSHQGRKNGDRGVLTCEVPHSGVESFYKTHAT